MGAAIGESIGGGQYLPVEGAFHGAEGGPETLGILGGQDINDAFGFGQGHAAVHQGAAGIFSGFGRAGPGGDNGGASALRQHEFSPVAAEFGDILAGIAVGGVVDKQHGFIQELLPVTDTAERAGIARRWFPGIWRDSWGAEHPARPRRAPRPRKAHHAHPPAGGGGRWRRWYHAMGVILSGKKWGRMRFVGRLVVAWRRRGAFLQRHS